MIFHTGLLCLMQAVSVVFSDEICNNIQRKSKATLQSSEKSTPVFLCIYSFRFKCYPICDRKQQISHQY